MVFVDIPYVVENERINKERLKKEIDALYISESAKENAFAAIYNFRPRGVNFRGSEAIEAVLLESVLKKLDVPYRRINEPETYLVEENGG